MSNEFVVDAAILGQTDWVFSLPTRRYNVARDYTGTGANVYTNYTYDDAARPRLVRALGQALHDSLTAPGVVCTPTKVRTQIDQLRRFLKFLDDAGEAADRAGVIEEGRAGRGSIKPITHGLRSPHLDAPTAAVRRTRSESCTLPWRSPMPRR